MAEELDRKIIGHLTVRIELAHSEGTSEVLIYSFQNDEFDVKAWFNQTRYPSFLDPSWLKGTAKAVYDACLQKVEEGVFSQLTLRYWLDLKQSETGFALIGHLPHRLGVR